MPQFNYCNSKKLQLVYFKNVLKKRLSILHNLMFLQRMNSCKKTLSRYVSGFAILLFIIWYTQTPDSSSSENVITINKETWNLLQKRINLPAAVDKLPSKNFQKPIIRQENIQRIPRGRDKFSTKTKSVKSVNKKDEWLLEILRDSSNMKADPSAPKDSSYSIMKNNVRAPLDDNEPVILVWWPPDSFTSSKKEDSLEREFQGVCGKCRLTTDRSTFDRSNAVLFDNIPMKSKLQDLPPLKLRRPEQAFVLWHRETPAKTYHLKNNMVGVYDTMFNYTLSYRKDSDIYWYLGNSVYARRSMPVVHQRNPQHFVDKIINSKHHLAVWVVSNCDKTKGAIARMEYAQQLIDAGLNLSKYGKCFNKMAPRKDFAEFLLPYKFYLAFENSWHCKDYLTEKFWRNGLMYNLVPVLWGPSREDVAVMAPKHSYIHTEDFETPEALVKYLNYLDRNETAYREYFNWRLEPIEKDVPANMIRTGFEPGICKICRVLNENKGVMPHKRLQSSINWVFIDGADSKCLLYDLEKNTH